MRRGASPQTVEAGEESAATRYEVSERAGEGTIWVTYRVRMRGSHRVAALKALKSNFSRHATLPQALAINLERAAAVEHPNLAVPFDLGEEEGTLFFVSDWVSNISLENKMRRAPFNRNDTLNYMRQLAAALQALHENGLVHGDVRPRQIMMGANGTLKLTDAGVAQGFHDARVGLNDIISDVAFYYAPERWDGGGPSPAADLYAAGVVLYRMLAGRVPFDGPSPLSIAMRHRNDDLLMPSQFNPSCPEDLEVIALRLLEKSPSARFAGAAELLEALDNSAGQASGGRSGAKAVAKRNDADEIDPDEEADPTPRRWSKRDSRVADKATADIIDAPYDEKAERKKQRRREGLGALFALFWTLMSIGLLAGIVYGAYYFWIQDIPKEVKVPNYVGKNQYEGERLLASKGLKMRITREIYDPKRPSGTIISGERKAGQIVRAGREIGVTVSRGEEPITMYNFSELTLDQVRRIMQRDGLRLGQVSEQYHDQIPAGCVCGQYPEPGEPFRRSDPINLIISKGPQPTEGSEDSLLPPPDFGSDTTAKTRSGQPSYRSPDSVPDVMLVPRAVAVRVAIPSGSRRQEVRIEVEDAEGTHTVYRKTHDPGDLVDEKIQVTRQQGATATIRVYVGGSLYREIRV